MGNTNSDRHQTDTFEQEMAMQIRNSKKYVRYSVNYFVNLIVKKKKFVSSRDFQFSISAWSDVKVGCLIDKFSLIDNTLFAMHGLTIHLILMNSSLDKSDSDKKKYTGIGVKSKGYEYEGELGSNLQIESFDFSLRSDEFE